MNEPPNDKAVLGECIHALNLAAQTIESMGGDGSTFREAANEAKKARWAK